MSEIRNACAAALLTAALGLMPFARAATLKVNTGSFDNARDGKLSLREAALIADGVWDGIAPGGNVGIYCLTEAEKNQISGATFAPVPPSSNCSYNPFNETRYLPIPTTNIGNGVSDTIVFDASVTQVNVNGGSIEIDGADALDGNINGGRVILQGDGSAHDGVDIRNCCGTVAPVVRNLSVLGFGGHGVAGLSVQNATLQNLDIAGNAGDGVHFDAEAVAGGSPQHNLIGGSGTAANYIYDNAGSGIVIVGYAGDTGFDHANTIVNNTIGLIDDLGTNNHGNGGNGIALIDSRGNTVGGSGNGNVIGHNHLDGVLLYSGNAVDNVVAGNIIGFARLIYTPRPNYHGVRIANGAHNNHIGQNGTPNYISGNAHEGVYASDGGSSGNDIGNNLVGFGPTFGALGNGGDGVLLGGGADSCSVHDNFVAANTGWGVHVVSAGVSVAGNFVGLRNDGSSAANTAGGVFVDNAANVLIGQGNQIGGNGGDGVLVSGSGAANARVLGNFIGVSGNGAKAANSGNGVTLANGAGSARVGSATAGDRNIISGNGGAGVRVQDAATSGANIVGNTIGTNAAGAAAIGNGAEGIALSGIAQAKVMGNLVSGNGNDGIKLSGTTSVTVTGNRIGVSAASDAIAVPNTYSGISVYDSTKATIGTTNAADANVIGGNPSAAIWMSNPATANNTIAGNRVGIGGAGNGDGVYLVNGAHDNTVRANLIGLNAGPGVDLNGAASNTIAANLIGVDASGAAKPNGGGVRLIGASSNNIIGGSSAAGRNVISGNAGAGVGLYNTGTTGNQITGNYIGTNAAGSAALANAGPGVLIQEAASGNSVASNTISGNAQSGVRIRMAGTSGNSVVGNVIGAQAPGTAGQPLPNGGDGVTISESASNNSVASGNTIAFNAINGVTVSGDGTLGNGIRANAFAGNAGLAIDLGADGVTANHAGYLATAPNHLQNYPHVLAATDDGVNLSVRYYLVSPHSLLGYVIDIYQNTFCDNSGHGEGELYRGAVTTFTDANGYATGVALFPHQAFPPSSTITATATDISNSTSEMSACQRINDEIFGDGFDGNSAPPIAPPEAKALADPVTWDVPLARTAMPADFGAEALDVGGDGIVSATLRVPESGILRLTVHVDTAAPAAAQRTLAIAVDTPVVLLRASGTGAACHARGRIRCTLSTVAGRHDVELELRTAPAQAVGLAIEFEDAPARGVLLAPARPDPQLPFNR